MVEAKQSFGFLPLVFRAYLMCSIAGIGVQAAETTWCIAKPSTDQNILLNNLDYSCKQIGVNCSIIQPKGGACYVPNNAVSHASVAMNLYYKAAGKNGWNCNFNDTGLIIHSDPSVGTCTYEA